MSKRRNRSTYERASFYSWRVFVNLSAVLFALLLADCAQAQEKIKVSYSSTDTLNSLWTIAQDAGFFKKHGLDAEVVYIGSTTAPFQRL